MSRHADILDEQESSLKRPLAGSLMLHAGIVTVLIGFSWWKQHNAVQWGDQNPLGGAIGVSAVDKIPLPNRGLRPNPVANDTDSSVPQKPEKVEKIEKRPVPKEEPDAVSLRNKKIPPRPQSQLSRKYPAVPQAANQIYNNTGPAVNSPLYGQRGVGGIGIGQSTVAGRGCGGYLELIRQRIQTKWDAQPVANGFKSTVVASLNLQRSGTVRGVAILQATQSELGYAAQRAIMDASPFPPFLPTCEGNEAKIEVRFEPKR